MKLYEFVAKSVFAEHGIPTPEGTVVSSEEDIGDIQISFPVAVKSQILTGGRGKAGGIKFATNTEELKKSVRELLGATIKGYQVDQVLVEEKLDIDEEFYIGVTIDRSSRCPVAIASASGGVDIEEVAEKTPERVVKKKVDPLTGLRAHQANYIMKKIGMSGKKMLHASQLLQKLYTIFVHYDAELTEINPLVLTNDGKFIAADGRLNIDNASLYRHEQFKEYKEKELTPLEVRAKEAGLSYVELDGNIGILGNGAGLVMATLDSVTLHGGRPANFCDLGGGSPRERVVEGIDILLSTPMVEGVFINILGGITRCDDVAAGIVEYRNEKGIDVPFVVRLVGTNEKEAEKICKKAEIDLLPSMDKASKRIIELVEGD